MLWTRHAWGTHLGCVTGSPHGQFPDHSQSVAGSALVDFIMIAGSTSKQPPERELWKNKAYFSQVPEALWGLDRESKCGPGVLPLLRLAVGGGLMFWGFILYWWILNVWGGIKVQEWKSSQVVSYLSHWVLSKKGSCMGGVAWSLCGYVLGNVFCWDTILPSGCLTIEKLNVRLSEYQK